MNGSNHPDIYFGGKNNLDSIPEEIREHILSKIRPSDKERLHIEILVGTLKKAIFDMNERVKFPIAYISAEGSTGKKQTQLKGASDIDLFIVLKINAYQEILSLS